MEAMSCDSEDEIFFGLSTTKREWNINSNLQTYRSIVYGQNNNDESLKNASQQFVLETTKDAQAVSQDKNVASCQHYEHSKVTHYDESSSRACGGTHGEIKSGEDAESNEINIQRPLSDSSVTERHESDCESATTSNSAVNTYGSSSNMSTTSSSWGNKNVSDSSSSDGLPLGVDAAKFYRHLAKDQTIMDTYLMEDQDVSPKKQCLAPSYDELNTPTKIVTNTGKINGELDKFHCHLANSDKVCPNGGFVPQVSSQGVYLKGKQENEVMQIEFCNKDFVLSSSVDNVHSKQKSKVDESSSLHYSMSGHNIQDKNSSEDNNAESLVSPQSSVADFPSQCTCNSKSDALCQCETSATVQRLLRNWEKHDKLKKLALNKTDSVSSISSDFSGLNLSDSRGKDVDHHGNLKEVVLMEQSKKENEPINSQVKLRGSKHLKNSEFFNKIEARIVPSKNLQYVPTPLEDFCNKTSVKKENACHPQSQLQAHKHPSYSVKASSSAYKSRIRKPAVNAPHFKTPFQIPQSNAPLHRASTKRSWDVQSPVAKYIQDQPSPSLIQVVKPKENIHAIKAHAVKKNDFPIPKKYNHQQAISGAPVLPPAKYCPTQRIPIMETPSSHHEKHKKSANVSSPIVTRHVGSSKVVHGSNYLANEESIIEVPFCTQKTPSANKGCENDVLDFGESFMERFDVSRSNTITKNRQHH